MTLASLAALENQWTVLIALVVLGAMELLGVREMKASRARRAAARKAFDDRASAIPPPPRGLRSPPEHTDRNA